MDLWAPQRCAVFADRGIEWELTFKQAEELAKTLSQMKFVLQGTQGMFLNLVNYVELC
jgi:hypothetical protein